MATGPLPLRLLRNVFELAASEDLRSALTLVRISRLTRRWYQVGRIDPILFSSISLSSTRTTLAFIHTIESSLLRPPRFFTAHVKSLSILFDMLPSHASRIVAICSRIDALTTWFLPTPTGSPISPFSLAQALGRSIRPRRISVWHGAIHAHPADPWPTRGALFTRLTHLTATNVWEDWQSWRWGDLPSTLQYVSLDLTFKRRSAVPTGGRMATTVHRVLAECPGLQVLALRDGGAGLSGSSGTGHGRRSDGGPPASVRILLVDALRTLGWLDPRIVFFSLLEPFRLRGAHFQREDRMWTIMEDVVRRRLNGTGPHTQVVLDMA
ncbi:unnamed protein product [Mycena citricolor]|uniref:F-box domain-containing protein n=1 Tax=Mycena citricolor TaxID=2018698 RepID=A0AAD2GZY4_9AGAR|nr:unnamed protein product [Mycena citricolor]